MCRARIEQNRVGLMVLVGLAGLFGIYGILNLVSYIHPGGTSEDLIACGVSLYVSGHCAVLWWIISRAPYAR